MNTKLESYKNIVLGPDEGKMINWNSKIKYYVHNRIFQLRTFMNGESSILDPYFTFTTEFKWYGDEEGDQLLIQLPESLTDKICKLYSPKILEGIEDRWIFVDRSGSIDSNICSIDNRNVDITLYNHTTENNEDKIVNNLLPRNKDKGELKDVVVHLAIQSNTATNGHLYAIIP